jgi:nucleoside-diphosphate-sugar epimerase
MSGQRARLFILGANGFVGREVVKEARRRGIPVKVLVRDCAQAGDLAAAGAQLVRGDAASPTEWIREVAQSDVLIDLVQPRLPDRIGRNAIRRIAETRIAHTQKLLASLATIPPAERPLLLAVSGLDDLAPDAAGEVHDDSPLRTQPTGFGHIGIPVRHVIEQAEFAWAYAYLGTVYGPGKAFARRVFPQISAGRFRMAGKGGNRMPMVHVEDAARALVHLATLPPDSLAGRSFVVADGSGATMAQFAGRAAELLGAPPPRTFPVWLARLALGAVLFETLTRDIGAHPSSLVSRGFTFRYPSYIEGLPPALSQLGYAMPGARRTPPWRLPFGLLSVAAVGALLAENLLDFAGSVPRMKRLSGGLPLLDMRPWYSASAVARLFDALGAAGRGAYLRLLWSVDLCLPALFALFLSGAIRRGRFRALAWVPFAAAACDYAENIAIAILLLHHPEPLPTIVHLSSALTSLKFAGYLTSLLLAIAGVIARSRRPPAPCPDRAHRAAP